MGATLIITSLALLSCVLANQGLVRISGAPEDKKVVVDQSSFVQADTAHFYCQATGEPRPTIMWWSHGQQLTNRYFSLLDGNTINSVLWLTNLTLEDRGEYHCVAFQSADGEITSLDVASANLDVYSERPAGFPEITDVSADGPQLVELGEGFTLSCEASHPASFSWFKDNLPVDLSDPRISLYPSGDLVISTSDHSDGGRYACVAENEVGTAYSNEYRIYIRECLPSEMFTRIGVHSVHEDFMSEDSEVGTKTCEDSCEASCANLDSCKAYSTRKRWYGCQCYLFSRYVSVAEMDDNTSGVTANRQCIYELK